MNTVVAVTILLLLSTVANGGSSDETRAEQIRTIDALDLLTLRDLHGLKLSPDGSFLAVQMRQTILRTNNYQLDWYVQPVAPGGEPIRIGDGGTPIFSMTPRGIPNGNFVVPAPKWSPNGLMIAYLARKGDINQLVLGHRDSGTPSQLTHGAVDVQMFHWARNNKTLFFTLDRATLARNDAIRKEGKIGYLFDDRFLPFESSEPMTKAWFAALSENHNNLSGVLAVDVGTGLMREPTIQERDQIEELFCNLCDNTLDIEKVPVQRAPRTKALAWLEPARSGREVLSAPLILQYSTSSTDENVVTCSLPQCTGALQGPWWSSNEKEIYFLRTEGPNGGRVAAYAWSHADDSVRIIRSTNDWISDCSLAGDQAICFYEEPTRPRRIISIDMKSTSMKTLFDPNSKFKDLRFGKVDRLEWVTTSGDVAHGYLVKPIGYVKGQRYPLIITTYSARGFLRGGTGDEYPVHLMAANGFVVLDVSQTRTMARRVFENEASIAVAVRILRTDGIDKQVMQQSLDTAVEILDEMGVIDTARIGLTGLSSGSEATHYALHNMQHLAVAAASGPASFDPSYYYLGGGAVQDALNDWGYGFPDLLESDVWRRLSVSANIEKVTAPFLIQAADTEFRLSAEMHATFLEHKKPIEMYVFPGEYHIKWQPKHRHAIYRRNIQWFQFWLQGVEVSDPVDPEQYTRWRKLRAQHIENFKSDGKEYTLPMSSDADNDH